MKKLTTTLIILLTLFFASSIYATDWEYYYYFEDFESQSTDWNLNPNIEFYYGESKYEGEDLALFFVKPEEPEDMLVMSRDFGAGGQNYGIHWESTYSMALHYFEAYADFTFYYPNDYSKTGVVTYRKYNPRGEFSFFDEFEMDSVEYSLGKVEIYIEQWNSDHDAFVDSIRADQLYDYRPIISDYAYFYISFIPSKVEIDEQITMRIMFYFGFNTALVDIYIVIVNDSGVYFFPDWTERVQFVAVEIPQYFCFPLWQKIDTYRVADLPLEYGNNIVAIGVCPHGTTDFDYYTGGVSDCLIILKEEE